MITYTCENCKKQFTRSKSNANKNIRLGMNTFCSKACFYESRKTGNTIPCSKCGKLIYKAVSAQKTKNIFCSQSCAATYNNSNKSHGVRRSKLETWIEKNLTDMYPELEIHYNRKDTINSELDIYIPSVKLAFELNGIFHYEPIYGSDRLSKITNNDTRKYQACLENNIELCIIDTSSQKRFTEISSKKFLDIIVTIINMNVNNT